MSQTSEMSEAPPQPVVRSSYATNDPLEAREFVDEAYGARLRVAALRQATCQLTLERLQVGGVEFADLDLPLDLTMRLPGRGEFVFATVVGGTAEYERERGQDTKRFARGDTYLGIQSDGEQLAHTEHLHVRTVSLPATLLDDVAASGRDDPSPWSFTSMRPGARGARIWRQTIASVGSLVDGLGDEATPLVTGPASRLLAATALATFPNTAVVESVTRDRSDATPDTLRRAIAFIETNPDLDITLADIARAACVTPRAVQLAFRRQLDTTPLAYLRQVRLQHARQRLVDAAPGDGTTVTRTAFEWGFAHPGRFAERYRAVYGELPSDTLSR